MLAKSGEIITRHSTYPGNPGYIWIVTNRKEPRRRGRVQLIDGTRHFVKMRKSLGNKRNEIGDGKDGKPDQIGDLTRLYANFKHDEARTFTLNGKTVERACSKILANHELGYLRLTIDRPLRQNFQASPARIARLDRERAFEGLAESKKRKDSKAAAAEVAAGQREQAQIRAILATLDPELVWRNRDVFLATLEDACDTAGYRLMAPIRKAVLAALAERDPTAEICRDRDSNPEPDPELRDTEIVPLPASTVSPLPIGYTKDADNTELVATFKEHCETYFAREVLPHWPDAWIDWTKTRVGYEIPLTRQFYVYEPPRELEEIENDIRALEGDIVKMLNQIAA